MPDEHNPDELLRPYIPRLLISWLRETPNAHHREVEGTLAFVDISGFTTMTERLARKGKVGAEEVNDTLDLCFGRLLDVAYDHGASVVKWGGDAVLLLFDEAEHAPRAARAAAAMQRELRRLGALRTSSGLVKLRMSVGIHSGAFDFFLVGELHRELVITGAGASRTVDMESIADAGEVVVSPETAALLTPRDVGAQKGPGLLLRRAPDVHSQRSGPAPDTQGLDLATCLPLDIRELLLGGAVEPEHRSVTTAFLEFSGLDGLLEREGPDAVAEWMHELIATVQRTAARHGVTFLETDISRDGGKVMLIAGAPRTTGHDEEGMLRTVRQIVDAGCRIPIRIGVNSGRVFAGNFGPQYRRTYSVKGDAVNTAARIMGKSHIGGVLVTEATLARSAAKFETVAVGPFALKGKAQSVAAFELGALEGRDARRSSAMPLVGRDRELSILRHALDAARGGTGRLVELVGEPGIGKSRLVEEVRAEADDFTVLELICEQYEASTPYFAFHQAVRSLLGLDAAAHPEVVEEALRDGVLGVAPELARWLPLLGVLVGVEIPDTAEVAGLESRFRRVRLVEVASEFLRRIIRGRTLLVVEDTHWMDEASAELLRHLALEIAGLPWLLVTTRRDVHTGFVAAGLEAAVVLEPRPLDSQDALALIDTDDSPLPPHVVATLAERAGGNPLFLGELLAAARSEGVNALPDTLEALLANQIDRLGTRDRAVLRVASVLGASFSLDILAGSLDASGFSVDDAIWQRLAGFVHVDSHGTARFRHALIRDAAYEGLPYRRRLELHARVGETLEHVAGATPDEHAELLSLHFLHAHRFDKAWRYARIAGERAQAVYANLDAAEFFGRALQAARRLHEVEPLDVAQISEALGDAQRRAGLQREAASAFRAARRLRGDDNLAEAGLWLKEAFVLDDLGDFPQTLRLVRRGLNSLQGVTGREATARRAQLKVFYGAVRQGQGRSREAIRWCTEAVEEAKQAGEKKALAHAYLILDWADISLGRPAEATRSAAALALYEELGDLDGQALTLNNMGARAYFDGRWDDALRLYERAQAARERLGDVVTGAEITYNIAEILVDRGRLTEADELVRRSLRIWRASGQRPGIAYATRLLGRIESRLGRSEEGTQLLFQAREEFRELGAQAEIVETDARIAGSLARQGLSEGALQVVTEALGGAAGPIVPLLERTQGFALVQLGDTEGAREAFMRSLASARARSAQYEEAISLDALVKFCELSDDPAAETYRDERDAIFSALGVVYVPSMPLDSAMAVAGRG